MRPRSTLLTIMIAAVLSTVVIAVGTGESDIAETMITAAADLH